MKRTETPERAVLIVEHDVGVRTLLGRLVSQWGCTPLLAESEDRGVHLLGEQSGIALVLSDFQPDADGETVYEYLIRRTSAPAPHVLCTLPSARAAPENVELVPRPFDVTLLRRIINQYVHGDSGDSDDSDDSDDSGDSDSGSAVDAGIVRPTG